MNIKDDDECNYCKVAFEDMILALLYCPNDLNIWTKVNWRNNLVEVHLC